MRAFRFKLVEDDVEDFTAWYQEPNNAAAPFLMEQLRAVHPDAAISIERGNKDGAQQLNQAKFTAFLNEKREAAGWTKEEIIAGHEFPEDANEVCDICLQRHGTAEDLNRENDGG